MKVKLVELGFVVLVLNRSTRYDGDEDNDQSTKPADDARANG